MLVENPGGLALAGVVFYGAWPVRNKDNQETVSIELFSPKCPRAWNVYNISK